jgi:hypothetical protein
MTSYTIWCQPNSTELAIVGDAIAPITIPDNKELCRFTMAKDLLATSSSYFATTFTTGLKGETDEHISAFNLDTIREISYCIYLLDVGKYDYSKASYDRCELISHIPKHKLKLSSGEKQILRAVTSEKELFASIITAIDYYGFTKLFKVVVKCILHDFTSDVPRITYDIAIICKIAMLLSVDIDPRFTDLFLSKFIDIGIEPTLYDISMIAIASNADVVRLAVMGKIPKSVIFIVNDALHSGRNIPFCYLESLRLDDLPRLFIPYSYWNNKKIFELSMFLNGLKDTLRCHYKLTDDHLELYRQIIGRLYERAKNPYFVDGCECPGISLA